MTSNRLAQVILAEMFGARPEVVTMPPELRSMLGAADACVLIGDIGMAADGHGLHVLDLGQAWTELTGKPFLWAAWIGDESLTPELVGYLLAGAARSYVGPSWVRESQPDLEPPAEIMRRLIDRAMSQADWDREVVRDYYANVMVYDMDEAMLSGLREFGRRLVAFGFDECRHSPQVVDPQMV